VIWDVTLILWDFKPINQLRFQDHIRFLLCDYRQLPDTYKYDRIIAWWVPLPANLSCGDNDSNNTMIFDVIFQRDDRTCWPWIYGSVFRLLWIGLSRRRGCCSAGTTGVLAYLISSLILMSWLLTIEAGWSLVSFQRYQMNATNNTGKVQSL